MQIQPCKPLILRPRPAMGAVARRALPMLVFALAAASAGCEAQKAPTTQAPSAATQPDAGIPAVLATIGGTPVTMNDVRQRVGDDLDRLDVSYQRAKHKIVEAALDSILREKVLVAEAQKQGKTLDDLVNAEAASQEPTEVDIASWYTENQARLGGRTLDQLRPQIADLLRKQRRGAALEKLQQRIYAERKVSVKLQPFRFAIDNGDAPATGKSDAPITLVEFSDFQCPYCGGFFPTLKRAEKEFAGQVKVVYRQFPLTNIHPFAEKAAEASLCANEQGKFWQMHDAMFQDQAKLTVADLKAKAGQIGLNQQKFDSCLDAGRYVERVQADQKEGAKLGINGTPAVFINGAPLEGGAVAYETLADAIRKELARATKP